MDTSSDNEILHEGYLNLAEKRKYLKRNGNSFDSSKNNYSIASSIESNVDNTQNKRTSSLHDNWYETVNHMISESCKLAQKLYNTMLDWIGKVLYCELYKRFKFHHTDNWLINKPESVLGMSNERHQWDVGDGDTI